MTPAEIMALEGRELDEQIAVVLFGWRWYAYDGGHYAGVSDGSKGMRRGGYIKARVRAFMGPEAKTGKDSERWKQLNLAECSETDMSLPIAYSYWPAIVLSYSSCWKGMGLLVDAMKTRGYWLLLKSPFRPGEPFFAGFTKQQESGWNGEPDWIAESKSAPLSVARAALLAVQ